MELLARNLERDGWCRFASNAEYDAETILAADRAAELLGRIVGGRSGATREIIVPRTSAEAHPRSQSAMHGLNALPLHAELSHRLVPCRYVVLGCLDAGQADCATTTLEWRALGFTPDEIALIKGAPLLIRNGRKSFYSTAIPPDERFLRYDGACVEAINSRGLAALETIRSRLSSVPHTAHHLQKGDILVIDNWRALHGREIIAQNSGRRLTRRLVDA